MTRLEILFQSVKVALGIFIAFLVFGYVKPVQKLGSVYGNPAFNDYVDAVAPTTTLANYPGILHVIDVTSPVASSIITVYDSASSVLTPATKATGTFTFGVSSTSTSTATGTYFGLVNGLTITSASLNNGSTSVAVATAFATAVNASSTSLNGITASSASNVVTLTAPVQSVPFTLSVTSSTQNCLAVASTYTAPTGSPVIATISIPSTPITAPFTLTFDNIMVNGLTVVQSGATSTLTAEYQQN